MTMAESLDFNSHFRTFRPLTAYRTGSYTPREELPAAFLSREATTYGWDSVNCIKASIANDVLKKSDKYPHTLTIDMNPETGWQITANFDAWQIAPGGSGAILFMKLPLTTARMTYGSGEVSFKNGYALISIKLRYVPQEQKSATLASAAEQTIADLIADAEGRSTDDPAVTVQRIHYGDGTPSEDQRALFLASFAYLMNQNLAAFQHVFAAVNLNQKAAESAFQWLKPTYTSYAYFQGIDDSSSYFAVLNQVESHSPEGLTNQVAASAIPDTCDSSILISHRLFLERMVLPGLTQAFTKAPSNAFRMPATADVIESTQEVKLDPVKVGAINYTPIMTYFRLQVVGAEVQIVSKVKIPISPGIVAYVNSTYFYVLGLVKKDDGTYTMDFEPSEEPEITSWHEIASWVTWTEVTVALIGSVVGAVVAEAIKQTAQKIIAVVVIIVVAGVLAVVPSLIADVIADGAAAALPPIGPLIDEAQAPVNWPDSSGFDLKSAELNGALQFGGLLKV
ncbi:MULTISPECIES: TULIP family P47-like protein [unclassified Rhizobium]|uniref:TULIP family P47-like protein n=2 Tax=Rhizobium TaxID=379 RepID=UPI0009E6BE3A|nr:MULTISPECIES: TULIP family P47-like protein [unclassified Rhizobium]